MEVERAPRNEEEDEDDDSNALTSWLRMTRAASTLLDRRTNAEAYWSRRTRPDGRLLLQCRRTSLETNVVTPSLRTITNDGVATISKLPVAGSSLVRIGNTHVLAVVTLQVGYVVATASASSGASGQAQSRIRTRRNDDREHEEEDDTAGTLGGDVVITCSHRNLIGASASSSSAGSADPTLTSYLQRVVEENADLGQLYLPLQQQKEASSTTGGRAVAPPPPPQAYRLCLGVEVLADDGNVRDAALLACTAALADTCLPSSVHMDSDNQRVRLALHDDEAARNVRPLRCPRLPIPLTIGVWESGDTSSSDNPSYQLVVDPTKEEHAGLSGIITVVVDAIASEGVSSGEEVVDEACVLSCEMKGRADLTTLALAVKLARGRAKELLPLVRP